MKSSIPNETFRQPYPASDPSPSRRVFFSPVRLPSVTFWSCVIFFFSFEGANTSLNWTTTGGDLAQLSHELHFVRNRQFSVFSFLFLRVWIFFLDPCSTLVEPSQGTRLHFKGVMGCLPPSIAGRPRLAQRSLWGISQASGGSASELFFQPTQIFLCWSPSRGRFVVL